MNSRLRKSSNPAEKLGIILATRFMKDENAIPLLTIGLKNEEDDVRLLAFLFLEQKNAIINTRIEQLRNGLKNSNKTAIHNMAIARSLLEMVTLQLIQDEMKTIMLQKAYKHLLDAESEAPDNRNVHFIIGQTHFLLNQLDQAKEAFLKALALGFSPSTVYPYLCDIAYQLRQYNEIPGLLQHIPEERRSYPPLAGVSNFWLQSAA
jgi:tetratricopeptide (TPR) repeat protein